jgi:hypothetical protein
MDFSQFVAIASEPKQPELTDFERMTVFAHSAQKDELWLAMGMSGVHPIYRNLIANALQRRLVEEFELEQTRKRKLEEEARLATGKDSPGKDAQALSEQAPRRRMR